MEVTVKGALLLLLISKVLSQVNLLQGFNLDFQQNDYKLKPEHVDVVYYNKRYMNIMEIKTFKYNRTSTAFNITYSFKFKATQLEVIAQAYKFSSNEYRLFPMRLQYNACKAVSQNFAGSGQLPCGNATKCPVLKDAVHHLCNWAPNEERLSPYFPPGRYMMEFLLLHSSVNLTLARAYAEVIRAEV